MDPSQLNRNTGQNISPTFQKKVFRQLRCRWMDIHTAEADISRIHYDEASNSLWKDWTMNSMLDYDLEEAQSNTWIDERFLDAILSEAHVASSESGMDLLDWSMIDYSLSGDKLKKRQNACRKKSSKSVKTRHQPARVGITKVLHHNKSD